MSEEAWLAVYAMSAFVPSYGVCLFVWWWKYSQWKASPMYLYIMILFAGQAVRNSMETYAYHVRAIQDANMNQMNSLIYDQWWWPVRLLLPLAITLTIVLHLSWRVFSSRRRDGGKD
jgi:hypothetical protein